VFQIHIEEWEEKEMFLKFYQPGARTALSTVYAERYRRIRLSDLCYADGGQRLSSNVSGESQANLSAE
jgi:hypothetical protein